MASGINNTFRQLGIATGIAALGAIFATQGRGERVRAASERRRPSVVRRRPARHPPRRSRRRRGRGRARRRARPPPRLRRERRAAGHVLDERRDCVRDGLDVADTSKAVVCAVRARRRRPRARGRARRPRSRRRCRRSAAPSPFARAASRPSPGRSGAVSARSPADRARRRCPPRGSSATSRSRAARRRPRTRSRPRAAPAVQAVASCERSRNSSQTWITRQPRLTAPWIANARTGMPASIAPGSAIAVRAGSPSYS